MTHTDTQTLYYRQGSSDKVYTASIVALEGGYQVQYAYGRRGSTLTTGIKNTNPVDYDEAVKIFNKLIADKTAKGYTPGEDGTPYTQTANAGQISGVLPQLLNIIDEREAAKLVMNNNWLMQKKFDGKRIMLRKTEDTVEGINKRGLVVDIPAAIVKAAKRIDGDFIIDGEAVGDRYYTFDLIAYQGQDWRDVTCAERILQLSKLIPNNAVIIPAATWVTEDDKAEALHQLRCSGAEGAVFKQIHSAYRAGRPASGGTQRKLKFVATLSACVAKINTKRSIAVSLKGEDDDWVFVGNVTVPPNQAIPNVGDVVEVRYLYAFENGNIYQPVFLGVRDDIEPYECTIGQLKYKEAAE